MIDKNKGHIKLNDSLELTPNSNFDLIESLKLGELQEIRDIGTGYKWIDIKNIQIDHKYFIISLCFKETKLSELSIVINDNPFHLNSGWESWSEKEEKEKLNKYQDWLSQKLGNDRIFKWGEAWASYDPKSCSSSIGIRYK
jgi:hypothetical protein